MSKTTDKDKEMSPADRLKAEAEAKKKADEAAKQAAAEAEAKKQEEVEAEEAVRRAEADEAANGDAQDSAEDPAMVAAREERFRRAEAFEQRRAERRDATSAENSPHMQQPVEGPQSPRVLRTPPVNASAADKLNYMAQAIPRTTPDNHTLFGLAGVRFTAGDLRRLVGMN